MKTTDDEQFFDDMAESMLFPDDVPTSMDILSGKVVVFPDHYSREYTPMVEVIFKTCIHDLAKLWMERKDGDETEFNTAAINFIFFLLKNFSQKIRDRANSLARDNQVPIRVIYEG